jgi:hypothetical protein
MWNEMPEPPRHAPAFVEANPVTIHGWRPVVSTVDIARLEPFAPGSEGERLMREGRMHPAFARVALHVGQILDIGNPIVAQNPGWFRFPARDVTPEDVERAQRLEQLENGGEVSGEAA